MPESPALPPSPAVREKVRTRYEEFDPSAARAPAVTMPGEAASAKGDEAAHIDNAVAAAKAEGAPKSASTAADVAAVKATGAPRNPDGSFAKREGDAKPEPKADAKPEAKPEPAKPEPPKVTAEEERARAGLQAIVREEARLRGEKQAFKAEKTALTAELEAARSTAAELKAMIAGAKADPVGFLQRSGLVVEDVIRAAVADPSKVTSAATREQTELAEIRKMAEEAKAEAAKAPALVERAKAEAQREALVYQLGAALKQNADTFEATLAEYPDNAAEIILGYIDDMKAAGHAIDIRTAADRIEEHCMGVWKQRHERASTLKKLTPRAAAEQIAELAAPTKAPREKGPPTTITNDVASSAPGGNGARRKPAGYRRDEDDHDAFVDFVRKAKTGR